VIIDLLVEKLMKDLQPDLLSQGSSFKHYAFETN